MGKLLPLLFLVVFHFIDCRTIIDGQNLHSFGLKPQTVYVTKEQFPTQEANKQIPVYVSSNPVSSYRINQQFPAQVGSFGNQFSQSANPNQYTNIHGIVPYSNQYTLNTPNTNYNPNLYLPYNNLQVSSDITTDYSKPVQTSNLPQVQPGAKVGSVQATPLYQHQIYHPLHTNTQNTNKQYKQLPTPPKIYRNFHPMIPQKPQQIQEPKIQKPAPESEEKEEVNNEQEEENENLEQDEDHEEQQEEEEQEEYYKPKYFEGKFDSERYRHQDEAEDDDDDRYSSSKVSSKYKYPKEQKRNKYKHDFSDSDFDGFRGFKDPKVEIKMYKYSKTMKKPERREFLEGKESRNIPVVQHSQKSYKEQWIISSKSSSTADE